MLNKKRLRKFIGPGLLLSCCCAFGHQVNTPTYSAEKMTFATVAGPYSIRYQVSPGFPKPNETTHIELRLDRPDKQPPPTKNLSFTIYQRGWLGIGKPEVVGRLTYQADGSYRQAIVFTQPGDFFVRGATDYGLPDLPLRVGSGKPWQPVTTVLAYLLLLLGGITLYQKIAKGSQSL